VALGACGLTTVRSGTRHQGTAYRRPEAIDLNPVRWYIEQMVTLRTDDDGDSVAVGVTEERADQCGWSRPRPSRLPRILDRGGMNWPVRTRDRRW
jgi:hypothetical protein